LAVTLVLPREAPCKVQGIAKQPGEHAIGAHGDALAGQPGEYANRVAMLKQ
jgi:hypothetical protein